MQKKKKGNRIMLKKGNRQYRKKLKQTIKEKKEIDIDG